MHDDRGNTLSVGKGDEFPDGSNIDRVNIIISRRNPCCCCSQIVPAFFVVIR